MRLSPTQRKLQAKKVREVFIMEFEEKPIPRGKAYSSRAMAEIALRYRYNTEGITIQRYVAVPE